MRFLQILFYPIIVIFMWWGFRRVSKTGLDLEFKDEDIYIKSVKKGVVQVIEQRNILRIDMEFDPPLMYPVVTLRDKSRIELKAISDFSAFEDEIAKREIIYNKSHKLKNY